MKISQKLSNEGKTQGEEKRKMQTKIKERDSFMVLALVGGSGRWEDKKEEREGNT